MPEEYFSEDGCDKFLAESGLLPTTGVWVDCGAAHPWRFSQTAFLRNRGWTGLAIDGNPAYAPEWEGIVGAKFVQAVLSDKQWERFLPEPTNALVSRVHETGTVTNSFTIREVLLQNKIEKVDFLAIDIEGMEAIVLKNILWQHDVPLIVAEYNSTHKGRDPEVFNAVLCHPMCDERPYKLVHLTESNAVFAR